MRAETVRIGKTLKRVEKYEIIRELGKGGIGIVYLGKHRELKNYVAVKSLLPSSLNVDYLYEKFKKEAELGAQLGEHPNIVKVTDLLQDEDGYIYIVMEYISREGEDEQGIPLPGYTLADLTKMNISEKTAIDIFLKVCEGLDFAHKMGVVHRDLKPSNILVGRYGQVKVSDFGIAKVLTEGAKESSMSFRIGTYAYMAPEQIMDEKVGFYSDIYALGIIFYELLTSRYPYKIIKDTDPEYIDAHRFQTPNLDYITNPKLKEIITRCLEKNPENRYQNVGDLIREIKGLDKVTFTKPSMVEVPLLVGKRKEEGIKELQKAGLGYHIRYEDGKDGYILGQDIADGKRVEKGTIIEVIVGRASEISTVKEKKKSKAPYVFLVIFILLVGVIGLVAFLSRDTTTPEAIYMPDLKGKSLVEAKDIILGKNLLVGLIDSILADEVDKGEVVSFEPQAGVKLTPGTEVNITYSCGRKTCPVCHTARKFGARYCANCGYRFE